MDDAPSHTARHTWLITGGMGFLGMALTRALRFAGEDIALFDNLHPQVHTSGPPAAPPDGVSLYLGDVGVPHMLERCLADVRPHFIVHFAAETGTGQSLTEPMRHTFVNGLGTANLIQSLQRADHTPDRILLASSRAVYGEGRWRTARGADFYPAPRSRDRLAAGLFTVESPDGAEESVFLPHRAQDTFPNPASVYGATKLLQEHLLRSYADAVGCGLTVLRLQNVYGFGQSPTNPYTGIVMYFISRSLAGLPIEVYEDGLITRDFVHVSDVVSAILASITHGCDGIVDIGSGTQTEIRQLASLIAELLEGPRPVVTAAFRPGDVRSATADIRAAASAFGYSPTVELADGLAELLAQQEV